MTKKEKKAEALRLKAAIDAKHPKPENTEEDLKKQLAKINRRRYKRRGNDDDDFAKYLRDKKNKTNKWDWQKW